MKKMMTRIVFLVAIMLLPMGCASLNPLDLLSPSKPSIDVDAAVGKNVKQEESTLKVEQGNTEQTAETISNDTKYEADIVNQITQNIPIEYLLITVLLAGWVIPSPRECYDGVKWIIVDIFNSTVVPAIKGIADFTLLLLGRERL